MDAYLARLAVDYLVGFTLSPLLWRKLPAAKSAGAAPACCPPPPAAREKSSAATTAAAA